MDFRLAPLPYAKDALEPHLSGLTLELHYEKHQRGYLEKLRQLVEGKPEADEPLESLVRKAQGEVFENAAQVWNHDFYWRSLRPGGAAVPADLMTHVELAFGDLGELKSRLADAAIGHFGSGWAWLALDARDRLRVVTTHDAANPLREGGTPILAIDVWEHAYYLDYLNDRARYVHAVVDHLLDWEFAAENLRRAIAGEDFEESPAPGTGDSPESRESRIPR